MLLVVNIGNTNIRFAVFGEEVSDDAESWYINSKPHRTEDEFYAKFKGMYASFGFKKSEITDIVIASVVPPLTQPVFMALKRMHKTIPLIVDRYTPSNVQHNSNQMGTDIYANAVAAQSFYKGNKIVIDFGTALTFVAVDENGKVGGAIIAPGVETALNSLVGQTAQLLEVPLQKPKTVLGMDTETCMQSGIVNGYISMVEGMIEKIKKEQGKSAYIIATGGLSAVFAPLIDKIDQQDVLHTVKGVVELYRLNKKVR